MKIIIINGPNLNLLGSREPEVYGATRLDDIEANCIDVAGELGHSLVCFQSNAEHELIKIGKAGRNRWKGVRPQSRGVVMNPVDHPHGGGEGKTSGGRHPVSPWGKPEGRTRKKKASDQMIVRRRKSNKKR